MKAVEPAIANRIRENWCELVESVSQFAQQAGRSASEIQIVGISKYVDADLTRVLAESGCHDLGESRPQSLWAKAQSLQDLTGIRWHMGGHLQRNKLRRTLPLLRCLHSLDNLRLAGELNTELVSRPNSVQLNCLVEVNVTQDPTKTGLPTADLPEFLQRASDFKMLNIVGLMAMSTLHASSSQIRREFEGVRHLLETMKREFGSQHDLTQLSMGMSDDYPEAIAEGATILRIGSTLWKGIAIDQH